MTMIRNISTYISILLFLMAPAFSFSDDKGIEVIEREIIQLDSILVALQSQSREMTARAGEIARQISELRQEEPLSFFNRQRLESLLKESLTLTQAIETLQLRIKRNQENAQSRRRILTNLYDQQIEQLLKLLDSKPAAEQQKFILTKIQKIKRKKEKVQATLFRQPFYSIQPGIVLKIDENDTPESLKRKADFLKDREDRYRKIADQLGERIDKFEKERMLRERMSDFISDIALFDHQDDPLQNTETALANNQTEPAADEYSERNGKAVENQQSEGYYFLNAETQIPFSQSLTTNDLDGLIEKMKQEQEKFQKAADSLSLQAEQFYKATQIRKIIFQKNNRAKSE